MSSKYFLKCNMFKIVTLNVHESKMREKIKKKKKTLLNINKD